MTLKSWLAVGFICLLAGCATPLKKQAFNKEMASSIKILVVTQTANQEEYEALVLGHPGMSFGLVGALVAAADMQEKSNRLTAAIDPKEVRLQQRLSEKLSESLRKAGYETRLLVVPKGTEEEKVLAIVRQDSPADGALALTVIGRYTAAGPKTDYFPQIIVKVKKFDLKSGSVLYEDTFSYGYSMPRTQTVHFGSNSSYQFRDIDSLIADPAKTREGLIVGLDAIVGQITADLKKN